jgi:hypothetical protein
MADAHSDLKKEENMKRRGVFACTAFLVGTLLSMVPAVCSGDGMGDFSVDVTISTTPFQEWMPQPEYNAVDNEFLVLWHTTGVREEGGEHLYSVHGQRISPEGGLLGGSFSPYFSPDMPKLVLPRPAHNHFTNEYMVLFSMENGETRQDPFIAILDSHGATLLGATCLSAQPTNSSHPYIAFNSRDREYLITYDDDRSGNFNSEVWGMIVDEDGTVLKEDFLVNVGEGQPGDQINLVPVYNPTDNTYLVNWEDYREVQDWRVDPGNIYGALLDAEGNIITPDIPMVDDVGMENEGDQKVQYITYNSDKNEFLVYWWDTRPSLNNTGIVGRIIDKDGVPVGEDFTLTDGPGIQLFPTAVYVEKRQQYFLVWDEMGEPVYDEDDRASYPNADIYAKWLSPTGESIGTDIPICTDEGRQGYVEAVYNPVMDRFLIAWRDSSWTRNRS